MFGEVWVCLKFKIHIGRIECANYSGLKTKKTSFFSFFFKSYSSSSIAKHKTNSIPKCLEKLNITFLARTELENKDRA